MPMSEKRIPEGIKERLKKRLQENVGDVDKVSVLRRRSGLIERMRMRLRERLRKKLTEDMKMKLRERLRRRLIESMRKKLRERLRARLFLESRGRMSSALRERIRARLLERVNVMRPFYRRSLLEVRRRRLGDILLRSRLIERERMLEGRDVLERRIERLEMELKRKTRLLKEAYKVVKRVEELGGIDKIEKAMKLAYDTIVKAGSKVFKEAVEELASETGVDKKKVAFLVKKVGLKEAREILKKRERHNVGMKTIIVEGMEESKEQLPALAMRVVERLSKQVNAGNPGDMKNLSEAVFNK
jgi:hypothetical protein